MIKITNSGYAQSIFYANEPTGKYGSTVTVNSDIGLVQNVSPAEKNSVFKIRKLGGTRDYAALVSGKFECGGSFEYMLQDSKFIRQAFGEDSGSTAVTNSGPRYVHAVGGVTGTTYHHVMGSAESPGVNDFPSFTLELNDDENETTGTSTFKRIYNGCRVDSLSIAGEVDSPVSVNVDYIAQKVTVSSAGKTSVVEQTEDPFVFYQGGVYIGNTPFGTALPTGTVAEVNSFEFTLNNNLEAAWFINRGVENAWENLKCLKSLIPKGRDMESRLSFNFKDKTQYERFLGATGATSPQLTFTKPTVVIDLVRGGGPGSVSTSANNDWVRLELASVIFDDVTIDGSPEDVVSEEYSISVRSCKFHSLDDISSY